MRSTHSLEVYIWSLYLFILLIGCTGTYTNPALAGCLFHILFVCWVLWSASSHDHIILFKYCHLLVNVLNDDPVRFTQLRKSQVINWSKSCGFNSIKCCERYLQIFIPQQFLLMHSIECISVIVCSFPIRLEKKKKKLDWISFHLLAWVCPCIGLYPTGKTKPWSLFMVRNIWWRGLQAKPFQESMFWAKLLRESQRTRARNDLCW